MLQRPFYRRVTVFYSPRLLTAGGLWASDGALGFCTSPGLIAGADRKIARPGVIRGERAPWALITVKGEGGREGGAGLQDQIMSKDQPSCRT